MQHEIQSLKREVSLLELEVHRKAGQEDLSRALQRITELEREVVYKQTQIDNLVTKTTQLEELMNNLYELTGHSPGHL